MGAMTSASNPLMLSADRQLAFLGAGSMNGAILRGILAAGHAPGAVTATLRTNAKAAALRDETGITVFVGEQEPDANRRAAAGADVVFLGVKPIGVQALCREIAGSLRPDTVVVSVAAAVTIEAISACLNPGQPVIRTMPNTPLMVGMGAVGLSAGDHVTDAALAEVVALFAGSGLVHVVPEAQLDAVSAVSGSGPAYVFYLVDAMAAAGVELGLAPELSMDLARATVAGAGKMLAAPGADPVAMRRSVTSPNGTTERAIAEFEAGGIPGIIARGARAAADRAAQISTELAG
ncbi:pyrroline-5-carboxylate reductase [Paeniglutamicibacter cryotolerans]